MKIFTPEEKVRYYLWFKAGWKPSASGSGRWFPDEAPLNYYRVPFEPSAHEILQVITSGVDVEKEFRSYTRPYIRRFPKLDKHGNEQPRRRAIQRRYGMSVPVV